MEEMGGNINMGLYYMYFIYAKEFLFSKTYIGITYNRGIILYYIIKVYENLNVSY